MQYNCKDCEKFWESSMWFDRDWIKNLSRLLGDNEQYLVLYCPKCKRTERSW
jgi:hypothetical protein